MNQRSISGIITTLFEYNYWANKRILAATSRTSEEQYTAPTSFPRGNLRATLIHVLDAEFGWRILLTSAQEVPDLTEKDLPALADIEQRWQEEEAAMRAYLASMSDEALVDIFRYTNARGVKRERQPWQGLFQVINHGTQHRSEAAAMLTDFGQSPGDLDFTIFLSQSAQQPA